MNGYDEIAESWYNRRHWTRFKKELEDVATRWKGGRLLNVGCAHGPDFLPFKDGFELWGLDSSARMISLAVKYAAKFDFSPGLVVGEAACLPFKSGSFDCVISVATYHHLKTPQARAQAFSELRRVLRPGGEAFITVWNRWQRDFWFRGREVTLPWRTGQGEVMRYYYLFSYGEIKRMLEDAGLKVLKIYPERGYKLPFKYFSRNICVLAAAV